MSNDITVVRQAIDKMAPQFKMALPAHVDVERFVRVTMTAVQNNAELMKADRNTLYSAAMKAAQDGLLPDGREGAIVTFAGKAQWMPMVAGIMKKVRNSGEVSTWSVHVVKDGDYFDYELGDEERIVHRPVMKNRGATIAVYSIVVMKDGERSREVMGIDEVEAIRARSRSGGSGPWKTDFDEMAKKTVIRRHSKRLPMSTDLDGAIHSDDDLFMPPQPSEPEKEDAEQPVQRVNRRSKALQAVVDAEVVETETHIDEDGVIYSEGDSNYEDPI